MAALTAHRLNAFHNGRIYVDESSPVFHSDSILTPSPPLSMEENFVLIDTPRRKNKRKLSEPKKRGGSDFSIKRLCSASPGSSAISDSSASDDCVNEQQRMVSLKRCQDDNHNLSLLGNNHSTFVSVHHSNHGLTSSLSLGYSNLPLTQCPSFNLGVPCLLEYYTQNFGIPSLGPPTYPINLSLPRQKLIVENHDKDMFCDVNALEKTFPQSKVQFSHEINYTNQFGNLPKDSSIFVESQDDSDDDSDNDSGNIERKSRKNYKNMTRERRVEANARERTRVHTISAAFDALRRAVPSYSYNQKLSKLAILRIACSYIMALARLADVDCGNSEGNVSISFADCVDLCTKTIQTEGRARRRL